jgi:uncharacterized protein (TIGR02145 family)
MKKLFSFLLGILFSLTILIAQEAPPQAFSLKALIANRQGNPVVNRTVYLQISILRDNTNGLPVYVETFSPTTNAFGEVDIEVGRGTVVSGDFSTIEWSEDEYFLKIEAKLLPNGSYYVISVTQLLSVPYSLYAGEAGNGFTNEYSGEDNQPVLGEDGGIGVGTPANTWYKLSVNGFVVIYPGPNSTWGSAITLDATSQGGGKLWSINSLAGEAGEGQGKLMIASSNTAFLIIDKDGNVGIGGDYSPDYKLDVAGDINFTGDLYKNDDPYEGDYNALANKPDLSIYATKNMDNQNITNLADPVNSQDATTKAYVDLLEQRIFALEKKLGISHDTLGDIDGNFYNIVTLGEQTWMAENLKVTHYSNGDVIPNVTDNNEWKNLTYGAYSWYNNDEVAYKDTYGALYNWFTIVDPRNVCPVGWHVPSDEEWTTLEEYLIANGYGYQGSGSDIAKSMSATSGWTPSDQEGTVGNNQLNNNSSGFSALPNGIRYGEYGTFCCIIDYGHWWTSTGYNAQDAWYRKLHYTFTDLWREPCMKKNGQGIRCLKD